MSACNNNNNSLSLKRKKSFKNDKKAPMKNQHGKIAGCFCVIVAFFQTPWLERKNCKIFFSTNLFFEKKSFKRLGVYMKRV